MERHPWCKLPCVYKWSQHTKFICFCWCCHLYWPQGKCNLTPYKVEVTILQCHWNQEFDGAAEKETLHFLCCIWCKHSASTRLPLSGVSPIQGNECCQVAIRFFFFFFFFNVLHNNSFSQLSFLSTAALPLWWETTLESWWEHKCRDIARSELAKSQWNKGSYLDITRRWWALCAPVSHSITIKWSSELTRKTN